MIKVILGPGILQNMKADQERMHGLLKDTIVLLCRNGLSFRAGLRIQGLIGITVDGEDVFVIQIDESIANDSPTAEQCNKSSTSQQQSTGSSEVYSNSVPPQSSSHHFRDSNRRNAVNRRAIEQSLHTDRPDYSDTNVITIGDDDESEMKLEPGLTRHSEFEQTVVKEELNCVAQLPSGYESFNNFYGGCDQTMAGSYGTALLGTALTEGDELSRSVMQIEQHVSSDREVYEHRRTWHSHFTARGRGRGVYHAGHRLPIRSAFNASRPYRRIIPNYQLKRESHVLAGTDDDGNNNAEPPTASRSLHVCGYMGCGKRFMHRRHMLRHQSEKHGRQKTRILTFKPVWTRAPALGEEHEFATYD